ncbi:NTPase [Candidatus Bathyarchaeota archaeon]|nr:NTPase [Candidatus Bathyarchaeota archaeon]
MTRRLLLITGYPGVGKTTVLLRTVELLKAQGFKVGGMISREARYRGQRVGFEILDLNGDKRGWLAHIDQQSGSKIGRYRVNIEDLEEIGVSAILKATKSSDVIAIDEVGPMELFSFAFREAVLKAVESQNPIIAVIHWKAGDKLINTMKTSKDSYTYVVTVENRHALPTVIAEEAASFLRSRGNT